MNSLILDCSCGMNVYVLSGDKTFSFVDGTQNKHTDEILKCVDELLNKAKINVKELDNLCVCVGPGSFTGVRVAISITKGLALGTNAKVFELSNFDVIQKNNENAYYVLDGFSNFVYVRTVKNNSVFDECISIDDFSQKYKTESFDVYTVTEKAQNLLKKCEIQSKICENNIIFAFNEKIKKSESVDLNKIYPIYLRASQAEIERNKRLQNGNN